MEPRLIDHPTESRKIVVLVCEVCRIIQHEDKVFKESSYKMNFAFNYRESSRSLHRFRKYKICQHSNYFLSSQMNLQESRKKTQNKNLLINLIRLNFCHLIVLFLSNADVVKIVAAHDEKNTSCIFISIYIYLSSEKYLNT